MVLDTHRSLLDSALSLLSATRPVRESLFVLSSRFIIPALGRVCQHLIQAPGEPILTLNSSDRVSVPVVDCVRQLFVALEMVVRLTKFEAVVTSSRA